jgi:outer membrane protein assembly factor BamB
MRYLLRDYSPHNPKTLLRKLLFLFYLPIFFLPAAAQSPLPPVLAVTPSTLTVLASEPASLCVIDQSGTPVQTAEWSIAPPIAELQVENGKLELLPKEPGRATVTATVGDSFATASITILPEQTYAPGTVLWSVSPIPGFETLDAIPAMIGSPSDVTYYSIEGSKSENAILRAFDESGLQIWMTHLSSMATPQGFRNFLPPPGEVYLDQQLLSDHSMFIIGEKSNFAGINSTDPSSYGLPLDGQALLLHITGDMIGGLVILERGRFRDSIVDISPAGKELWRYRSDGRLAKNWSVNYQNNVVIVETKSNPASAALILIDGTSGQVRFRIPFPTSSSKVSGYPCTDPHHKTLASYRPSTSGSVFTNVDGNSYVQVGTFIESADLEGCEYKQYSSDDKIALLRLSPDGQAEWKTFQHLHADGNGGMKAQPRVFAGETIPDDTGGMLAAWTIVYPDKTSTQPVHSESRLSRIDPDGQRDFTLPLLSWTPNIFGPFDENMVLGKDNVLYAINGPLLARFDANTGETSWVRRPPTGNVKLQHATASGGVLVSNAGEFVYFDAEGNGFPLPWTIAIPGTDDIGLVQSDPFDHAPLRPLALRKVRTDWSKRLLAIEDGAPTGHGSLIFFSAGN